ncbi:hypothetical protein LTR85_011568 [Meristemomyces frigidus]|nr:hypothetical protein LTR85_011568 [Meristemomyces frigidus]
MSPDSVPASDQSLSTVTAADIEHQVVVQHTEGEHHATASLGHGTTCSEIHTNLPGRKNLKDHLVVHHPLGYSDVRALDSNQLWFLHDRLRQLIAESQRGLSPVTDRELVARCDSWVLIDMFLRERYEGKKAEPSLKAGFQFPKEHDEDVPPLDLDASSRPHPTSTFGARTEELGIPIKRLAAVSHVLDRCSSSTSEAAARKAAHLQRLDDDVESSDEDKESDVRLPQSQCMERRYGREERRLGGLIRDKARSKDCPPGLGAGSEGVASAGQTGEGYMLSGALEPSDAGYLPAEPDTSGLITSDGKYDADSEATVLSILRRKQQHTIYTRAASNNAAAAGLDLFMRLPACVDEDDHKQTAGQQILSRFNKSLMLLCWWKKSKAADYDRSTETAETQTSGTSGRTSTRRLDSGAAKDKGYGADSGTTTTTIKSGTSTSQRHSRPPPPPPPKNVLLPEAQVELELARKLQDVAYQDDRQRKRSAAHTLRGKLGDMFTRKKSSTPVAAVSKNRSEDAPRAWFS